MKGEPIITDKMIRDEREKCYQERRKLYKGNKKPINKVILLFFVYLIISGISMFLYIYFGLKYGDIKQHDNNIITTNYIIDADGRTNIYNIITNEPDSYWKNIHLK